MARFSPVLRYLVEYQGMYSHPSQTGFTAGQEAWSLPRLQFSCHRDAKEHAVKIGGTVIKLRISAKQEAFKRRNSTEAIEEDW